MANYVDDNNTEPLKSKIINTRKTFSWPHEYKWKRLAKASIEQYKQIVDVFLDQRHQVILAVCKRRIGKFHGIGIPSSSEMAPIKVQLEK